MSQFQFDQDSGGVYNPFEAASTEQAARDAVQGLQLPLASPGKRLLGSIIDSLLGALAVLPGLVIMGAGVFSAFSAAGGPGGNMGMPPGGFVEGEFPGVVMEGPGADGSAGSTGELSVPPTGDFGAGGGGGFTGPGPAPAIPPGAVGSLLGGMAVMGLSVLIIFGLQIYLLCTRSQSVGKICMGTLIVDQRTGKRAGAVSCVLLRFFLHGVITSIPNVGSIYALVDALFIFRQDRRCLHDMIASTVVVEVPR
ncbi:MAG: RDD family protein [Planctomyces sp.]|jgi:uncharacterized RDD family membrane protein YckC|nr:RDD family protein [Planctomyces sp.]